MKKVLLMNGLLCVSLFGKELTLSGNIITTHNEAGGGYGIQTQKGVYGLCYMWDNEAFVNKLQKLEESGQPVKLSGNQVDKWSLDCDSIKFPDSVSSKPTDNLNNSIKEYTKCLLNNDFECQIKFMDKEAMKKVLGEEVNETALLQQLKSSGIQVTNVKMGTPSKIVKNGSVLSSKVTYSAIVKVQGEKIEQKENLNAISKDDGLTWLFSQSNDSNVEGTHCKENEDVVFSCDTGKKVVSVCSSKNQSNNYIQYRFGKLDNPEALIPKNPTEFYNSVSAFHLNVGGTAEAKGLEFTNGDYLYGINSINNYFYVRKNGKDIAELSCKKDMIDNIDIEYLKAFGVKTETDE